MAHSPSVEMTAIFSQVYRVFFITYASIYGYIYYIYISQTVKKKVKGMVRLLANSGNKG